MCKVFVKERSKARTVMARTRSDESDGSDLSDGPLAVVKLCRASFEEGFEFGGGFATKAGDFSQLFYGGEAHPLDRAEFFEERGFASFANVGKFVENAFGNFAEAQRGVVGVGEAMRFVADALEEF